MNYYHRSGQMDLTDRVAIEVGLCRGESFKKIAKRIGRHPSTVSHEVLENRTHIEATYYAGKDCRIVRKCITTGLCGASDSACHRRCKYCKGFDCRQVCDRYISVACHAPEKPPYVCNTCKHRKLTYELSPLAVIFMFQTGLRISEVCAVRYEDIEDDRLHVQRMLQRDTNKVLDRTKGTFQDRYVFMTPESLKIVKLAKKRQWERGASSDGYIFSVNGKPCSCSSIATRFRNYCKWMGVEQKSSHKVRKTFVSAALDAGINLNTVREAVGHQDERTTLKSYLYDRSGTDHIKEQFTNVIDRIHVG